MWVGAMSGGRAHRVVVRVGVRVGAAMVCGIVTTIAVAWGSAGFTRLASRTMNSMFFDLGGDRAGSGPHVVGGIFWMEVPGGVRRNWMDFDRRLLPSFMEHAVAKGADAFGTMGVESRVGDWGNAPHTAEQVRGIRDEDPMDDARGWPRLALWCEIVVSGQYGGPQSFRAPGGIVLPWPRNADGVTVRVLPYRPIWRGFAIDSLLFAAVWSPVFLFKPGRGWLRIRRGRCPRCGYELGASGGVGAGCPECGWGR